MTSLTPYSESLERVRSVLVFYAVSGPANAAVLAELESEVRAATGAARRALLPMDDIRTDLERIAMVTLPASAANSASRVMGAWVATAFHREATGRSVAGSDGKRV